MRESEGAETTSAWLLSVHPSLSSVKPTTRQQQQRTHLAPPKVHEVKCVHGDIETKDAVRAHAKGLHVHAPAEELWRDEQDRDEELRAEREYRERLPPCLSVRNAVERYEAERRSRPTSGSSSSPTATSVSLNSFRSRLSCFFFSSSNSDIVTRGGVECEVVERAC